MREAWGKYQREGSEFHHLIHHSADVAAVLLCLFQNKSLRARAEYALGKSLSISDLNCLSALAFLHDIGKLSPRFQAKAWPEDETHRYKILTRGHLECGSIWLNRLTPDSLSKNVAHFAKWPDIEQWFPVLFAHHGRPIPNAEAGHGPTTFQTYPFYDWQAQEKLMGQALSLWFPEIAQATAPKPTQAFLHYFCGILTLADWIGSDKTAFPFKASFDPEYWQLAQRQAARRVEEIGLGTPLVLKAKAGWSLLSDHPSPRPAQMALSEVSTDEPLVLLEAETGAGKTEAALWRFINLLEAGKVETLYFAVPTRAAATQLHRRVNDALKRMFDLPPGAILAIPGQATAGMAKGKRLPDFSMLWDDSEVAPKRWAAEHAARYLAAQIAIGTVDQVALAGLQVKYAHLRGTCLARSLLVIDEVHASDAYMSAVQQNLMRSHLALGGHALLMSATLGSVARRKWLGETGPHDQAVEAGRAYPSIWTSQGLQEIAAEAHCSKEVRLTHVPDWSAAKAAELALQAARQGARVLVIRNTVQHAQETFASCLVAAPDLLLTVDGTPTLHHSRFAAEDRARLDSAVEAQIGKDSPLGGRIVIGTQTLEQSLDLCADLLITDLCPLDVLLQRIGRLHRHNRPRAEGFSQAQAMVLSPAQGLAPLTQRPENGLGAKETGATLAGVYIDLAGLAATLEQIDAQPMWRIPQMNRRLVEAATHPEPLAEIAARNGWQSYHQRVTGKALAEMQTAGLVLLDRNKPLVCFPDDEKIKTRLGEDGVIINLPIGTLGAFGAPISRIALPAHWSRGLSGEEEPQIIAGTPMTLRLGNAAEARAFHYDSHGLQRAVIQ